MKQLVHKKQTIIKVEFTIKLEIIDNLPEIFDGNIICIEWNRGRKLKGTTTKTLCRYGRAEINQEIKFTSTIFTKKNSSDEYMPKLINLGIKAVIKFLFLYLKENSNLSKNKRNNPNHPKKVQILMWQNCPSIYQTI